MTFAKNVSKKKIGWATLFTGRALVAGQFEWRDWGEGLRHTQSKEIKTFGVVSIKSSYKMAGNISRTVKQQTK